jgi:hypothetical protein
MQFAPKALKELLSLDGARNDARAAAKSAVAVGPRCRAGHYHSVRSAEPTAGLISCAPRQTISNAT